MSYISVSHITGVSYRHCLLRDTPGLINELPCAGMGYATCFDIWVSYTNRSNYKLGGTDTFMPDSIPTLTPKEIQAETFRRLEKYEKCNLLEQFALFMGLAQILELQLKQFASRKYGIDLDSLDRHTLGQVANLLRTNSLRPDFLALLDSVVQHRNHIAHDLLASQSILVSLGAGSARFEIKILQRGLYELEQLCFLFEWTEQHNAWGASAT